MSATSEKAKINIYVVMPFSKTTDAHTSDYWTEHFSDFISNRIKEVVNNDEFLREFDWDIIRSSTVRGGPLNYEIVWDLFWATIVIVDLTDLNPNVMYELGVRHALTAVIGSRRTIMIQDESAFCLPFDFANYAVVKYRKDKVDTWKRDLQERLKSCMQAFQYRDNPVAMTFAQHGFSFQQQSPQEQQMAGMKAALDVIERMKSLGFDVMWIQELIGQGIPKDKNALPSAGTPTKS
jgi:hypothetical protein